MFDKMYTAMFQDVEDPYETLKNEFKKDEQKWDPWDVDRLLLIYIIKDCVYKYCDSVESFFMFSNFAYELRLKNYVSLH